MSRVLLKFVPSEIGVLVCQDFYGITLVKNENSSSLNVAHMKLGSVGLGNVCIEYN